MKYWANGFYLQQNPENTRIEISEEHWKELLNGQSEGKIITADERGYPILKQNDPSQKQLYGIENTSLLEWFNNIYTYQEQKYRRLITLQINCDDGKNPQNQLLALYQEAEIKRRRIQELENLLK